MNAAPALDSGESSLPTRRRLTGQTTSSSRGTSGQFVFFVVTAAVIGTGAGVGRNKFITSRAT